MALTYVIHFNADPGNFSLRRSGRGGKGSQGWTIGLPGLLGAFGEDCLSPSFCAAKIVEFRSRPIIPASLWPNPENPSRPCQAGAMMTLSSTGAETNGLSKVHSGLSNHFAPLSRERLFSCLPIARRRETL